MASHLSATQLETFIRCPRQWYETRYGEVESTVAEALVLGSAFHSTLEQDGQLRRRHKTPLDEKNILHEFLHQHLPKELAEQDPEGTLEPMRIKDMELRGEAMLKAYMASVAPRYFPVLVEDPFEVHIPHDTKSPLLDIDGDPWTVTGFIDSITINSRGEYVIVDWKTASKPWRPGAENSKSQASIYILAQLLRGHDIPRQVTFITFPTMWNSETQRYECGKYPRDEFGEITGDFVWQPDIRVTQRTLADMGEIIYALRNSAEEINKIRRQEITPAAKPHGLCPYCPVNNTCLSGLQWMASRKKKLPKHNFTEDEIQGTEETDEQSA